MNINLEYAGRIELPQNTIVNLRGGKNLILVACPLSIDNADDACKQCAAPLWLCNQVKCEACTRRDHVECYFQPYELEGGEK